MDWVGCEVGREDTACKKVGSGAADCYFDNIGECGSQPQTENQSEDTIMCIPERSPHKRSKDDEYRRNDSTKHGQQPYRYSLRVCIRVCERSICHTKQAAITVDLVEEIEQGPEKNGDYPVGGVADEYTPSTGPGGGSSGRAISLSGERVG